MVKNEDTEMILGLNFNRLINWLYKHYPEAVKEYEQEESTRLVLYT